MPVWLAVDPVAVVLGVCCPGLSYTTGFVVSNRGRVAVSLVVSAPRELRRHVAVKPGALRLRPGERRRVQLHLCARQSFSRDAQRFTCRLSRVTQFGVQVAPLTKAVRGLGGHGVLCVQVLVAVSPPALEIRPANLQLGHVLSGVSTATASLKLANRSLMAQEYGFVNIPEDVRVEPGGGFGKLRPGEVVDLKVVYSPVGAEGRREFLLDVDTVLGLAARSARLHGRRSKSKTSMASSACSVQVTADVLVPRLQLSAHRVTFPTTSVGAHATADITMTCAAAEAQFSFESPDYLQVIPPAGSLVRGQVRREAGIPTHSTCGATITITTTVPQSGAAVPAATRRL
ncbi:cilia- and flagella-associated protein 74-like [Thrips palmi]|uniref:Cilia- and flagella-associated protein 74-like n=1 Tax=Thrips palmi TaxID=161013 RepID=A0A6P8YH40_THRPL|nr:cilia- and flagella-associated protein 74-like [Thrips palmi]